MPSALPAIVALRDLGPLPPEGWYETVWTEGMRVVNDVAGTPIKPEFVEIGQLINAEPEIFYNGEPYGEETIEGHDQLVEKGKAAIIVVRMEPDDITPDAGQGRLGRRAASWPTPRSAPTSAAPSPCGSSRPTTCSAPATSRPSIWPTMARLFSDPLRGPFPSCRWQLTPRVT